MVKGSIMRLGDEAERHIDTTSTGSLTLDIALRCWRISKRKNY